MAAVRQAAGAAWPFVAMVGFVLGSALQLRQGALSAWPLYAALCLAGALLLAALAWGMRRRRGALAAALLAGACVGAGLAGARACAFLAGALAPALEGRDLQVVGVVAQMPQHDAGGTRFRLEAESARWPRRGDEDASALPDEPPQVPARIALGWYHDATSGEPAPALHAGERWRFTVRLKAPHGNVNPHGYDHELRLWEQGVQATGYVRDGARDAAPARLASTWRHPVERAREAVRDAVLARVADPRQAGVIAALVTGDQAAIERTDWDIFRATGVAHLMSISGLHVTMFAWLAAHVVGGLWRRSSRLMLWQPAPHAALVGGVLLAALYALFSGWGVPSQRTVCMLAAAGLLQLTGRRWPWPHVWLLIATVVVAMDPWALMQAGFWLSFVAVGVLFTTGFTPPADGASPGRLARLAGFLREQWVVTLALAPLGLLFFQQVSLVGLFANVVAIPWVTLVITPLAMLGAMAPPLWGLAAWAIGLLGALLGWLATWPWATFSVGASPAWMAACGVAGGLLLVMRLPWLVRVLGLPLLLPVLLWQAPRPAPGEFELLAADIGQGNAVLVRTATHSLLYDAGPRYGLESDAGHRVLVPLLRALDERLDMLVLSHRDSDHTGGAVAVLAMQPRASVLSSIEAAHPLQSVRPAKRCEVGQRWRWDGVEFEVLHPAADDYVSFTRPNAVSCVLRIGNGRAGALLAGDIERLQEAALVARTPALHADVLLVPHHGSKTSSSDALLDAVRPRIALVQAGYRNRFGHPAAEVAARYSARGVRLVENVRCGAARWQSHVPGEIACERSAKTGPYWHHRVP